MLKATRQSLLKLCSQTVNSELKQRRRQRQRKRHPKMYPYSICAILRDYFNSLNFYKNGELSRNQIGRSGVQVKKENEKFTVVCSHSPKNLKFGHFTLLFCRGQRRNVPNCKTHVQSGCFCSLDLLFCGVVVVVVAFKKLLNLTVTRPLMNPLTLFLKTVTL